MVVFIDKSAHLELIMNSAQVPTASWHIPIDIINQTSIGLNPEVISRNLLSPPLLDYTPVLIYFGHTLFLSISDQG